jgi:hypothetical protein
MRIDSGDPITETSDRAPKSTNKSFRTRNEADPSSIVIELMPLHTKADASIAVTEAGMERSVNEKQHEKTPLSIVVSLDGGSNVTDARDTQDEKQPSEKVGTEDGIAIDCSKSQKANAPGYSSQRSELSSNATIRRAWQSIKQYFPSVLRCLEKQTAEIRQPSKASSATDRTSKASRS